jgi:hypothetical protein
VPFEGAVANILRTAQPLETLSAKFPTSKPLLDAAVADAQLAPDRLRWLPIHYHLEFWTVLIDSATARPVAYVDFDPYGS